MADTLLPITIPPGMFRNGTVEQAAGRWRDGSGVRFIDGVVGPIGGARPLFSSAAVPMQTAEEPRRLFAWQLANGEPRLVVGTGKTLTILHPAPGVPGWSSTAVPTDMTATGLLPTGSFTPVTGTYVNASGVIANGLQTTGEPPAGALLVEPGTWAFDNFGDALVACAYGGPGSAENQLLIYTSGAGALPITGAPSGVRSVVVTPERFLVALGSAADPGRVTWASRETSTDWNLADPTNTAGDFSLPTAGRLLSGRRTKKETILFTDVDAWTMTHIGGTFVYRFDQAGESCGLVGPHAVAVMDTTAFWMGHRNFYLSDGYVRTMPCDVADAVFTNFNAVQAHKVWATTVAEHGEVWWFYPSATSTTCDRYVVYNTREQHWTTGVMDRQAGCDAGVLPRPVWAASDGTLYEHELTHVKFAPAFLESGPVMLATGERVMQVQRAVPDVVNLGDVVLTLIARDTPDASDIEYGPYSVSAETALRFTARRVRLRLTQAGAAAWRYGGVSLGVVPGGRR